MITCVPVISLAGREPKHTKGYASTSPNTLILEHQEGEEDSLVKKLEANYDGIVAIQSHPVQAKRSGEYDIIRHISEIDTRSLEIRRPLLEIAFNSFKKRTEALMAPMQKDGRIAEWLQPSFPEEPKTALVEVFDLPLEDERLAKQKMIKSIPSFFSEGWKRKATITVLDVIPKRLPNTKFYTGDISIVLKGCTGIGPDSITRGVIYVKEYGKVFSFRILTCYAYCAHCKVLNSHRPEDCTYVCG